MSEPWSSMQRVKEGQRRPLLGVNGVVGEKSCAKEETGLDRADIVRDLRLRRQSLAARCSAASDVRAKSAPPLDAREGL